MYRRMISALFILLFSGCNLVLTQQFHPQQQQQQSQQLPEQPISFVNGQANQLPAESRSLPESNKSPIISQLNPFISERPNIFQKLNIFSSKKRKNKDQDPMMASDSIPMTRFTPFAYPTSPGPASSLLAGQRSPFASFMTAAPSNRAINYFNPFLLGSFDPYASIARRMAVAAPPMRPPFLPMSAGQMPTYFPLGSMLGTPIMDPNIGAALASTLTNRYTQNPLGPMVGSSIYGTSLYEDPYDSGLLASALKRYFKSGGRGRPKPRDEVRMPSDYSYDKFEYGFTAPRYEGYQREHRRPAASNSNRYRETDYPRYQGNSYDYSGHSKIHPDDVSPGPRDTHSQSESNADDYRNYDGRAGSPSDSIAAPPPPPAPVVAPAQASSSVGRFRERNKDTNEGPYVDMYGWRGPVKSFSNENNQRNQQSDLDDGRREESSNRQPGERYGHDSPAYGSRSNTIPSPPSSTYKDPVNRNDLDAVSSDANEKGRSIY